MSPPRTVARNVGIGEAAFADDPAVVLATHGLGSCVAVVAWDPPGRAGAVLHFQLPAAALDPARAREAPFLFGDVGVDRFFEGLASRGVYAPRARVYLVGGAGVTRSVRGMGIGARNLAVAREGVRRSGGRVAGEAVGGHVGRTVWLRVADGRVTVRDVDGGVRAW